MHKKTVKFLHYINIMSDFVFTESFVNYRKVKIFNRI